MWLNGAVRSAGYLETLQAPHVLRSFVPSVGGRVALSTSRLALIILLGEGAGSFVLAGVVTGLVGLANVVATAPRARWIDRRGQTTPMTVLAVGHGVSLTALALVATSDVGGAVGLVVVVALSLVTGASTPPFPTTMRVLWSVALPPGSARRSGFSLDAVAGELSYAVGPVVAAVLAATVSPLVSLLASAAAIVVAALVYAASPLARAERGSVVDVTQDGPARSPLRSPGFIPLVVAMLVPGLVLGYMDIAAPALVTDDTGPLLAGLLLGLLALTSGISGLIYGRLPVTASLERQLLLMAVLLNLVAIGAGLLGGVVVWVVGFGLAGVFLAPGLIAGYLAADERADPRARTEANGWMDTAVQLGSTLGAMMFGALTGLVSAGDALACSGVVALAVALVCAPSLLRAPR